VAFFVGERFVSWEMSYNYPDLSLKEGNEGGESRIGETLAICRVLAPPPR
jgi:hypothetical protein